MMDMGCEDLRFEISEVLVAETVDEFEAGADLAEVIHRNEAIPIIGEVDQPIDPADVVVLDLVDRRIHGELRVVRKCGELFEFKKGLGKATGVAVHIGYIKWAVAFEDVDVRGVGGADDEGGG
jgi:hypothetical protein